MEWLLVYLIIGVVSMGVLFLTHPNKTAELLETIGSAPLSLAILVFIAAVLLALIWPIWVLITVFTPYNDQRSA